VDTSKPPLFPDNIQFWYEIVRAFGAASYGGSEFGEVMATAARITSGDVDSWYDAWNRTAERVASEAADQLKSGHRISARDSFLRAAGYHRASEFFLHGNPRDPRIRNAYEKSVSCYRACASLFDPSIEPVEIPYEGTTLPGYLHRVDGSGAPRPIVLMHSGFDGSAEEMHVDGARAAVERGYNVLAFDGPGQYGPLHREGLTFRPEWEKVVTPVVDFVVKLPGIDLQKIALMGVSLGGELAPRAAAYEKRIAALIANDGVYDYGAANLSNVPPEKRQAMEELLLAKDAPELDRMIATSMKNSPITDWAIAHGMYAMGASSPRAYLAATLDFNLRNGVAEAISCPTLICEAEGDIFFRGQPQQLFDHLTCPKTLVRFTKEEGAGAHCQVGAARLAFARIYDWLDQTFGLNR
jgi:pimeloyl-ACP methyl ester carboxylesterase